MEGNVLENVNDFKKYLQEGNQTRITPEIAILAKNIEGSTKEKIERILEIVNSLKKERFNKEVFRRRTAAEILKSGYVTGCTDAALAFIILARAAGIPTKYVETINRSYLKEEKDDVGGHIFAQSYYEERNEWGWVDPMLGTIGEAPKRVIYKEGLDSWDIGIKDFESLKEAFEKFKMEWKPKD